ncbi:hypothetical protein PMAYCL1PPCAC_32334, partial [Pristionchus mayeri]
FQCHTMEPASASPSFCSRSSGSTGSNGSQKVQPRQGKIVTNVYPIVNDYRAVFRYSVAIDKVVFKKNKQPERIQLSRAGGQDAIRIPRERVNGGLIKMLSRAWGDAVLLYEGSALLFSNISLPTIIEKRIEIDDLKPFLSEWDYNIFLNNADYVVVSITPDDGIVDITSLVRASNSDDENMMISDFLATLAREHAPEGRFVAYRGGKLLDTAHIKDISFGHARLPGISMGVNSVRNEKGLPQMALNIDVTEATIYKEQHLIRAICEFFGGTPEQLRGAYGNRSMMQEVERYIRDIPVRCEHNNKVITVCGLKWDKQSGNLEPWTSAVCKDEEFVNKYPGSAVVTEMFRAGDGFHERYLPMDSLWVMPGTRVPKEKQKGAKPKPMGPAQRYNAMQQGRKDIHIDTQNDTLRSYGTAIAEKPVLVDPFRLDAPKMQARGPGTKLTDMRIDPIKHNWRSDTYKYVKGAKLYEMFYIVQRNNVVNEKQAQEFMDAFLACLRSKGMMIGRMAGRGVANMGELEETVANFDEYRRKERQREGQDDFNVMLFLLGEKNVEWHDRLKMLEQRYSVQTQHIFADTIKKVLGKPAAARAKDFTMFNIALKTNQKLGGENFKIGAIAGGNSLFPSEEQLTLIVGLDVAHPPPLTRQQTMRGVPVDPSCIGISSNCMTPNLQGFTGYEVYTESRREAATQPIMNREGRHLIKNFMENQDGRLPTSIVYFRDGVDKGQYTRVKDEFHWMVEGMKEHLTTVGMGDGLNPREVIILATKRHNIRAYEPAPGGMANVKAGTVIDCGIVSPFYPEFFLYASHALIGTAKGLQCTVLRDSKLSHEESLTMYQDWKLKDMEKFVHALAYGHQICDSPTSLPEPLYHAHETAKRGAANFKAYRNTLELREVISPEELTKKLSNRDTELARVKYNA